MTTESNVHSMRSESAAHICVQLGAWRNRGSAVAEKVGTNTFHIAVSVFRGVHHAEYIDNGQTADSASHAETGATAS